MSGLIIKDFRLLKGQMNFFVLFMLIGCAIAWFSESPGFTIGYIGFIGSFFTLSTVSYDEFNNGYAFMFTLPISRKTYVSEKYVFGILLSIVSILAGAIPAFLIMIIKGNNETSDFFYTAFSVFAIVTIMLSVMLPLQIKFGSEKSRLALLAPFGVLLAVILIAKSVVNVMHIDLSTFLGTLANISPFMIIIAIMFISLVAFVISISISYKIMNKKEL